MAGTLSNYFSFYQLPVGRRLFLLDAIARLARTDGKTELTDHAEEAAEADRRVLEQETKWRAQRSVNDGARQGAARIDALIDQSVTTISVTAERWKRVMDPGDPNVPIAEEFLEKFYPEGPGAITKMRYEEELALVQQMLRQWQEPKWRNFLNAVGVSAFVARLINLTEEFAELLRNPDRREITWNEIQALNASGNERVRSVAAHILGQYYGDSDEDVRLRSRYMGPLMDQNRRMADGYSRRRPSVDVNPETGEEIDLDPQLPLPDVDPGADVPEGE